MEVWMSHGWIWHLTAGLLEVLRWHTDWDAYWELFQSLLGISAFSPWNFWELLNLNLPMRTSVTVSPIFSYSLPDLYLRSPSHIPAIPNSYINSSSPLRLRMVLFSYVNPKWPIIPAHDFETSGHKVNSVKPGATRERINRVAYWLFSNVISTFFINKTSSLHLRSPMWVIFKSIVWKWDWYV